MPGSTPAEIVRRVVTRCAPAELVHFDRITRLYAEQPRALAAQTDDELLGADLGQLLVVVIPVAYAALNEVLRDATVVAGRRSWAFLKAKRDQLRLDKPLEGVQPAQVEKVYEVVFRRASAHLPGPAAEEVARAVRDELAGEAGA